MCETRKFRNDRKICRDLKEGFCIVAMNTRETILRLWDCYGDYTMYAPPGEVFDVPTIELWLKRGIGVVLPNLRDMDTDRKPLDAKAIESKELQEKREIAKRRTRLPAKRRAA